MSGIELLTHDRYHSELQNKTPCSSPFDKLPSDLIQHIFSYICDTFTFSDTFTLSQVSKTWRILQDEEWNIFWHELIKNNQPSYCQYLAFSIDSKPLSISCKVALFYKECRSVCEMVSKSDLLNKNIQKIETAIYEDSLYKCWEAIHNQLHFTFPMAKSQDEIKQNLDRLAGTRIESLRLNGCSLAIFPRELCKLNIGALDLSCNRLFYLPEEFGNLTGLTSLSLNSCRAIQLPKSFIKLIQLKILHLSRNGYDKVPDVVVSMQYLTVLNLSINYLTEFPPTISNCENLTTLLITCNCIKIFPKVLLKLQKLRKLDISENPIQEIPKQVHFFLKNLSDFNYRETPLESSCAIL